MEYFQHFKPKIFVLEGFPASVLIAHFEEECLPCAWFPASIPPCPDHQCSVAKIWHFIDFNLRTFVSFHNEISDFTMKFQIIFINLKFFMTGKLSYFPWNISFWCFSVGHGRNFFVSVRTLMEHGDVVKRWPPSKYALRKLIAAPRNRPGSGSFSTAGLPGPSRRSSELLSLAASLLSRTTWL